MSRIREKSKRMNLNTKEYLDGNKNYIDCYGNKEGCRNIWYSVWMIMVAVATMVVVIVRMRHRVGKFILVKDMWGFFGISPPKGIIISCDRVQDIYRGHNLPKVVRLQQGT